MTATIDEVTTADLYLPTGMVGFPTAQRFTLIGGENGVFDLDSVDEPGLGFVVIAPAVFFPNYAPVIDTASVERLDLTCAEDALMLIVVNIGDDKMPPQANLMAPIVINRRTNVATQVILEDQGYPLRTPIPEV